MAAKIKLRMPIYENGQHEYFFNILTTALKMDGHEVEIEKFPNLPHLRERSMFDRGQINVLWLISSEERDNKYLSTHVPLTNGLIGHRIMLVNRNQLNTFSRIKSAQQLRTLKLTAGLGTQWFDADIWKFNDLPVLELANWRLFYGMLERGDRGVDYFPRGFTEILEEADSYRQLAIEPHLMFVYDRDFVFYVTPSEPNLAEFITSALTKAKDSGLMDRLIKKHWARTFEVIKPESRTIIRLSTPD
ncbi:hypothetical protein [Pseudodesulfovibrio sp. zrk46]|uniref:hypothetical protein n=1 Tax=Pseudodesulfovibrio sp. zrk46 TaxID=2725288 RepID=UPI0014492F48|nr:hypothetical protein [Pseudodesulfovibrio sp. zrk46]QJB56487.1 hypothetical protein HFN16_08715 [Pseudodesulfovibrio sp. zrk46]